MTKIESTKDYDKFKFIRNNRDISESHLRKICASMSEKILETHIIVNENFEIIEGQHRFLALKYHKQPIRYIIKKGYSIKETQRYNTSAKKWSLNDWLQFYLNHKEYHKEYHMLKNLMEKYDLSLSNIRPFCYNQSGGVKDAEFKEGKFEIKNPIQAEHIIKRYKVLVNKNQSKFVRTRNFIKAFMSLNTNSQFNWNHFNSLLSSRGHLLRPQESAEDYKLALIKFHNYKLRNRTLKMEVS